ncbi:Membrane-fusion protein [Gloeomargarita lithophora Alchichica-D10]|uniref:Membrane-fusion protein n=1 Tax=Gloeomargarita lithophora Alchichica-D10 TaxID=1188229 RepID=A0A1J0AA65_9CYAN|nr:efflux RND transporter periplasmic adaptor subunit [Gloeomargarita lithophora]APB32797.1 Membrane-fusion protein [Gloeomargarita lithophora Alchichica-D10]
MIKRLPLPRQRWVWGVILILVAGAGWLLYDRFLRILLLVLQLKPQPSPVVLTRPQVQTVAETSDFVARFDSRQSVTLQPRISGQVSQILVSAGAEVQTGQLLLRVDAGEQQAQVRNQQAAVKNAQAEVTAARTDVQAEQATLKSVQANQSALQADLELARQEYQRFQQLYREGAASQQELDQQLYRFRGAQARLEEAKAQVRTQQAAISRAAARLTRSQAGLSQAQASVSQAQANLQYYTITAPFRGQIGNIPVKVGDFVSTSTPLLTLTQNQNLELNLDIPLERAADLRLGLPVQLLSAQGEVLQTGRIFFISPTVNTQSQTVQVKASFANAQGQLRSDQFARVRVVWATRPGVVVPVTAISRLGGQDFVFLAQPFSQSGCKAAVLPNPGPVPQLQPTDLVAVQTQVQLGKIMGNTQEVLTGVTPDSRLIPTGILQLTNCTWIADSK